MYPSEHYVKISKRKAVEGLHMIRDAAFYMIIGTILVGISYFSLTPIVLIPSYFKFPAILTSLSLITVVVALIGVIIMVIGIYMKFLPGTSSLAKYSEKYSTPASLIKIGYLWGLILLVIGIITLIIIIGLFLVIVGGVLLLIGKIGLIMLMFRLNDEFRISHFLYAGILFIIGILIPLLDFISWILIYVGTGEAINKIKTLAEPPPYPSIL